MICTTYFAVAALEKLCHLTVQLKEGNSLGLPGSACRPEAKPIPILGSNGFCWQSHGLIGTRVPLMCNFCVMRPLLVTENSY